MQLSAVDKPPTYRLTFRRRLVNALISALVRLGAGPNSTYLLTTRGRRSGKSRSTPVTLVEAEGRRWLVAPYGPVGWVHNARTNKLATLSRGRHSEAVRLEEVTDPLEAARVLKSYVTQIARMPVNTMRELATRGPQRGDQGNVGHYIPKEGPTP